MNPSTFFHDKVAGLFSMLRLVVFLFAIACAINISPTMGWPLAIVCIFVLMAIPFSKLFESKDGATLFGKLIDKIGIGGFGTGTAGAAQLVDAVTHHHDPGA